MVSISDVIAVDNGGGEGTVYVMGIFGKWKFSVGLEYEPKSRVLARLDGKDTRVCFCSAILIPLNCLCRWVAG